MRIHGLSDSEDTVGSTRSRRRRAMRAKHSPEGRDEAIAERVNPTSSEIFEIAKLVG